MHPCNLFGTQFGMRLIQLHALHLQVLHTLSVVPLRSHFTSRITVSSGSLLRTSKVPSRSESSRSHAVQRNRSICLRVPVQDRCVTLPLPGWLNHAHRGFGHENRVYLSWAG